MSIFYVDGQYVPEEQAVLPVRDLAVLRGYGAFDYLRTYGGNPFRLRQNVQRFRRTCELIEMPLPWSDEELQAIVRETLRRNQEQHAGEFGIRMVITGGLSSNNLLPDSDPRLLVLVQPAPQIPAAWYEQGVKVITVDNQRVLPNAKSILYLPAILAQKRARERNAVEAVYRTLDGFVTEATTSNLFAVFEGTLVTPDAELLPGITRQTLLECAAPHYSIEERPLMYSHLLQADEAFLTSANKLVVPVVQVDEATIGAGVPGEHTRHLMTLMRELTAQCAAGVEV